MKRRRSVHPAAVASVLVWLLQLTDGFLATPTPSFFHSKKSSFSSSPELCLSSSSSDNDDINSIRRILEASWNSDMMGTVPSDPKDAAKEAFAGMLSATEDGKEGLFFVDLRLPIYDITQGSEMYDEVTAVEYCIELSKCLRGQSAIIVRDSKVLDTVQRVLDRRKETPPRAESSELKTMLEDQSEKDDGEDLETSATSSMSGEDIDDFRQQLMKNWDAPSDKEDDNGSDNSSNQLRVDEEESNTFEENKDNEEEDEEEEPVEDLIRYRLLKFFGHDDIISDGADMLTDVVNAVRKNALPTQEEENIIILSALSREEMVAVRSLVSKYRGSKQIVLVNSKLDPLPKELQGGETVYSILPLMAKPRDPTPDSSVVVPKVVVLRRYPRDWELYVDVGDGFELADSADAKIANKSGPPASWVSEATQKFLRRKIK